MDDEDKEKVTFHAIVQQGRRTIGHLSYVMGQKEWSDVKFYFDPQEADLDTSTAGMGGALLLASALLTEDPAIVARPGIMLIPTLLEEVHGQ